MGGTNPGHPLNNLGRTTIDNRQWNDVGWNDCPMEAQGRGLLGGTSFYYYMLEALRYPMRSFDARGKPVGNGTATTDFSSLLNPLTVNAKNCDYRLGVTM
jgi:hypothetical protein